MSSVNTNMGAVVSAANMAKFGRELDTSIERLSSGLRINSAKDDAAGMAIVSKMEAQVRGVGQAIRNATDAQKLIDTSEGAHVEALNILQRLRELAVQSSNDTNQAMDRAFLNAEATQLIAEIDRIAGQTTWNSEKILNGNFRTKQFQLGANANEKVTYSIDSAKSADIGIHELNATATIVSSATSAISGETLTVSGYIGSANISHTAGNSAATSAANVNAETAATGVSATAITKLQLSGFGAADTVTFTLGNGTSSASIGTVNISDNTDLRLLRDAINAVAGTTGITAAMDTNAKVVLTHDTGEDIVISGYDTGIDTTLVAQLLNKNGVSSSGVTGTSTFTLKEGSGQINAIRATGQLSFSSHKTFTVTSNALGATTSFFDTAVGTTGEAMVSSVSLSTAANSERAITIIDGAINKINQSRADLGAISNRLDSTISNLTNVATNVEGSMSNIRDADFSVETSKLTRAQILTQAATSMLAQANTSKQSILALLQG